MSTNNGAGPKPVAKPGKTSSAKFAEVDAKYAGQIDSMTGKERALAGLPYLASDPKLMQERINARNYCREYNASPSGPITPEEQGANDVSNVMRRGILEKLFQVPPETAKRIFIEPPFYW
jgi:maltose O-acetyltransferase